MPNESTKCPMCGYDPARATNREQVTMNEFTNEKTGEVCIMNSSKDRIENPAGVWIRKGAKTEAPIAKSVPAVLPLGTKEVKNIEVPKTAPIAVKATP